MKNAEDKNAPNPTRRNMMTGGLLLGGGALLAGSVMAASAQAQESAPANESILDKIIRTKKVTVAASLKYPPNMYINDQGEPDGYEIELIRRMMADIDPEVEVVFADMDFGQMFAAVETGRVDMMTTATNTPARALRGWFAGIAAAYQPVYVIGKAGAANKTAAEMDNEGFRFAALQGSSQEAKIKQLFPNAQLSVFPDQNAAIAQVMTGRADATLQSLFTVVNMKEQGVDFGFINTDPAYVDHNTFMLPTGDMKMYMYVTNWLLHAAAGGLLGTLYRQYVGQKAIDANLPYLIVGANGAAVSVEG